MTQFNKNLQIFTFEALPADAVTSLVTLVSQLRVWITVSRAQGAGGVTRTLATRTAGELGGALWPVVAGQTRLAVDPGRVVPAVDADPASGVFTSSVLTLAL